MSMPNLRTDATKVQAPSIDVDLLGSDFEKDEM